MAFRLEKNPSRWIVRGDEVNWRKRLKILEQMRWEAGVEVIWRRQSRKSLDMGREWALQRRQHSMYFDIDLGLETKRSEVESNKMRSEDDHR